MNRLLPYLQDWFLRGFTTLSGYPKLRTSYTTNKVLVEEVEEVLFDKPHIRFVEKGHREGEDLYAAYSQTADGRWLIVFFVLKGNHEALVISARDMDRKERRLYARR